MITSCQSKEVRPKYLGMHKTVVSHMKIDRQSQHINHAIMDNVPIRGKYQRKWLDGNQAGNVFHSPSTHHSFHFVFFSIICNEDRTIEIVNEN